MKADEIPLRHGAQVRVSNVDKKTNAEEQPVRLVNYTDAYYQDRITPDLGLMSATATREQIARFRVLAGDSIITKDSETPGDIAVPTFIEDAEPDMVCGYHLAIVRPTDRLYPNFLNWALQSDRVRQQFAVSANGMTRFGLTYDAIQSAVVPLPALSDQRRIADFLDDQVARIERIVKARQRQILLLGRAQASSLEALLNAPSTRPLKLVTDPARPIQYGIVLPGPDFPGGVPIIKGGDVAANRLRIDALKRTDPLIEGRYPRSRLVPGDLVMAIRGSVGEVAVVPAELAGANLTQDTARIAPLGVDPTWLRWVLTIPSVQSDIRRRVTGAMVTGINIESLREVRIPDVSAAVQVDLGREAEAVAHAAASHRAGLQESVLLLSEFKRSLISAAVTGEFDVSTAGGRGVPA